MTRVLISSESRFPLNRKLIKEVVRKFLSQQGVKSEVELSLAIVGDRKMRSLNKKYRQVAETTPVLAFSLEEGKPFVSPPEDETLYLGDIVISYPQAVAAAASENVLVDEKIVKLVEGGLKHLLGIV